MTSQFSSGGSREWQRFLSKALETGGTAPGGLKLIMRTHGFTLIKHHSNNRELKRHQEKNREGILNINTFIRYLLNTNHGQGRTGQGAGSRIVQTFGNSCLRYLVTHACYPIYPPNPLDRQESW